MISRCRESNAQDRASRMRQIEADIIFVMERPCTASKLNAEVPAWQTVVVCLIPDDMT